MFKKMMLLAGMALSAIAFAVPASASAFEWTDEGGAFEGTATDTLSGRISFGNPEAGKTKFGCIAHAGLNVKGGSTTGSLTSFSPTTGTCSGEGTFAGCTLAEDSTTIPASASLDITGTNTVTLTTAAGEPIVLHNVYKVGCPIEKSTLTVSHLTITGTNSNLTDATVSGTATSHVWVGGVQQPASTVAVFGTMGTPTDTISIK